MYYDQVKEAADFIRNRTHRIPETGIILGSGLGAVVDSMEDRVEVPYREIPQFPVSHDE